nr:immunoglobulin heavy chain junction region [Macaca mulatta]
CANSGLSAAGFDYW